MKDKVEAFLFGMIFGLAIALVVEVIQSNLFPMPSFHDRSSMIVSYENIFYKMVPMKLEEEDER